MNNREHLRQLTVIVAFSLVLLVTSWAAQTEPASEYHQFDRWGVAFEYPKSFHEWPQDRTQKMKDFISKELATSLKEGNAPCGERSLTEFTTLVSKDKTVAISFSKFEFAKAPTADDLLGERRSVLGEAKKANDVTEVKLLEKTQIAGCNAVREDVERSDGGRGVCLHLLDGKTTYNVAWIVHDKTRFADWEEYLRHLTTTLRVHSKTGLVVRERFFELVLPPGWTRTTELPQGVEYGFLKRLPKGEKATFFLHCEMLPGGTGGPPTETVTAQMAQEWDRLIARSFPGARALKTPSVRVPGVIIINKMYDLTDQGTKLRRRYTYFVAGETAFVSTSNVSPDQWEEVVADFDRILAGIKPAAKPQAEKITDKAATEVLKTRLPALAASFPAQWACSVKDISIVRTPATKSPSKLVITLEWQRSDIATIYKAVKAAFEMMREGKMSDEDFRNVPAELRNIPAKHASGYMYHVGQTWGCAWGVVANLRSPIDAIRIVTLDSDGKRVGSMTVSAQDASDMVLGKVDPSDQRQVARIYQFE